MESSRVVGAVCCILLGMFPAVGARDVLIPATRLRCDGSDSSHSRPSRYAFALPHDRPSYTFTWALPEGAQEAQAWFRLRIFHMGSNESLWDTGKVESGQTRCVLEGPAKYLKAGAPYAWEVMWCESGARCSSPARAEFLVGLRSAGWAGVSWLATPDNEANYRFSTAFTPQPYQRYLLHYAALGFGAAQVNGREVGPALTPSSWTPYERFVSYTTVDVTDMVVPGKHNTFELALGFGWRALKRLEDTSGDDSARVLRAILTGVTSAGNITVVLTSDPVAYAWAVCDGPIVSDGLYNGEVYDARRNSNVKCSPVTRPAASPPRGDMKPYAAPGIAVTSLESAASVVMVAPGRFLFDFKLNGAGVMRFDSVSRWSSVFLPGENVTFRHAEVLEHKGLPGVDPTPNTIYTANLRTAKATDVYVFGNGTDNPAAWWPRFTYHGFRYVEVTAGVADPSLVVFNASDFTVLRLNTDVAQSTNTSFSNELLNVMQNLALGAQRSNMMSIVTDCDQRDERLGWTGDLHLSAESIGINYGAGSLFASITDVLAAELDKNGSLPDTAPFVRGGGRPGDVSWTTAFPELVYRSWRLYNDTQAVSRYLPQLLSHLQNIDTQALATGVCHMHTPFGDWCPPVPTQGGHGAEHPTPPVTSVFSFAVAAQIVGEMAGEVGNTAAAQEMLEKATALRQAFVQCFWNEGNRTYDTDVMTDYVLAAALGDMAGGMPHHAVSVAALQAQLNASNHHFKTGIIGFRYLFDVLWNNKMQEDALKVLLQTTYPSIGYMAMNDLEPATSNLWEVLDAPYSGPGMNSRNHHMFSSYSAYLVKKVAGLDVFGEVPVVHVPHLRNDRPALISSAAASTDLPSGRHAVSWWVSGGSHAATATPRCGAGGGDIQWVSDPGAARTCLGRNSCSLAIPVAYNCTAPPSVRMEVVFPRSVSNGRLHLPVGHKPDTSLRDCVNYSLGVICSLPPGTTVVVVKLV